jgi:hypothetical protein
MSPETRTLRLPRAPKARGEVAEARFVAKAMSLGFSVSRPIGDSQPFDFIVQFNHRLTRVQVKSAWNKHGGGYHFCASLGRTSKYGTRPYANDEIDFIVAYVAPEHAWFVIPIAELGHRTQFKICLGPRSRLLQFKNRWDLLT